MFAAVLVSLPGPRRSASPCIWCSHSAHSPDIKLTNFCLSVFKIWAHPCQRMPPPSQCRSRTGSPWSLTKKCDFSKLNSLFLLLSRGLETGCFKTIRDVTDGSPRDGGVPRQYSNAGTFYRQNFGKWNSSLKKGVWWNPVFKKKKENLSIQVQKPEKKRHVLPDQAGTINDASANDVLLNKLSSVCFQKNGSLWHEYLHMSMRMKHFSGTSYDRNRTVDMPLDWNGCISANTGS